MARRFVRLFATLAALAAADAALALDANLAKGGLPSASTFGEQILAERSDVVSWKALAQVEPVKQGDRMLAKFSTAVLALDNRDARVQGFMIPLGLGERQKHFLISAVPASCAFCMPAGPEAVVEVHAKEPVGYTQDPIVVAGRFAVLKDDPNGLFYRLTAASQVDRAALSSSAPPGFAARPAPTN